MFFHSKEGPAGDPVLQEAWKQLLHCFQESGKIHMECRSVPRLFLRNTNILCLLYHQHSERDSDKHPKNCKIVRIYHKFSSGPPQFYFIINPFSVKSNLKITLFCRVPAVLSFKKCQTRAPRIQNPQTPFSTNRIILKSRILSTSSIAFFYSIW